MWRFALLLFWLLAFPTFGQVVDTEDSSAFYTNLEAPKLVLPTSLATAPTMYFGTGSTTGLFGRSSPLSIGVATSGSQRIDINANGLNLGSQYLFFSANFTAITGDVSLTRPEAGSIRVGNGTTETDIGRLYFGHSVETVATTKTPGYWESQEIYTNGSDADGQAFTLPNDPSAGYCFMFALTTTNSSGTFSIVKNTGETLQDGATICATSLTATAKGATTLICSVSSGSGALWLVIAKNGTWTCS